MAQVKLNAGRDGIMNTTQLFSHRVRGRRIATLRSAEIVSFADELPVEESISA